MIPAPERASWPGPGTASVKIALPFLWFNFTFGARSSLSGAGFEGALDPGPAEDPADGPDERPASAKAIIRAVRSGDAEALDMALEDHYRALMAVFAEVRAVKKKRAA